MRRWWLAGGLIALAGAAAAGLVALVRRWSFPVRKTDIETDRISEAPPAVFAYLDHPAEPMVLIREGTGPLFYRRYRADMAAPTRSAEDIMQQIHSSINDFSAAELAVFDKTLEMTPGVLSVGDEFYIRISGPWNGHVRTAEVKPRSFIFVTLAEHLERGEIRFEIGEHPHQPGALRFEITSWARSQDELVSFVYDTLGIAKLAQESLWSFFCQRVVEASGGTLMGEIHILTEKAPYRGERIEKKPAPWEQHKAYFERYRLAQLNYAYDPEKVHDYTETAGWTIDSYSVELPPEPPGAPVEGGPWQTAREIIRNYEFPDPKLVTGIFIPDDPLDKRLMVIRGRFLWWTFYFGVRINRVIDDTRQQDDETLHVWGYSYQTLEGHFEMGEITFEVRKYDHSGRVEFRVHAYSRTADIRNIFYRIGFRLFGRRLQKHFADSSLERMVMLVQQRAQQAVTKPAA